MKATPWGWRNVLSPSLRLFPALKRGTTHLVLCLHMRRIPRTEALRAIFVEIFFDVVPPQTAHALFINSLKLFLGNNTDHYFSQS